MTLPDMTVKLLTGTLKIKSNKQNVVKPLLLAYADVNSKVVVLLLLLGC